MNLIEKSRYVFKDEEDVVASSFESGYKYCLAKQGLCHKLIPKKIKVAGREYYKHLTGEEK